MAFADSGLFIAPLIGGIIYRTAQDGPCVLIDADPRASLAQWWNGRQAESPAFAPATLKELAGKLEDLAQAGYTHAFIKSAFNSLIR